MPSKISSLAIILIKNVSHNPYFHVNRDYGNIYITKYPNDWSMSSKYKFKIEYELQDDENPNDNSKIRFITYGDSAKEVIKNHGKLMDEWEVFLEEETEKTCEEEAYKTCEELEAMKNDLN
jgi:hypothetical protein